MLQKKSFLFIFVLTFSLLVTSSIFVETVDASPTWQQKADKVIKVAKQNSNKQYKQGGAGPNEFDCSGFTQYVFNQAIQYQLPRQSKDQANKGKKVNRNQIRKGDLMFFNTNGNNISHVAIYIGDNKMIHAANSRDDIIITDINNSYWKQKYVVSKRVIN